MCMHISNPINSVISLEGKGDKSETCSTADDIIELQDVRMSPIPSLRKGNYNSTLGSIGTETVDLAKFPPSFRITRNYGTNRTHLRYRGQKGGCNGQTGTHLHYRPGHTWTLLEPQRFPSSLNKTRVFYICLMTSIR